MAAAGPLLDDGLKMKKALQSAVQSVQWTYIIFWQFCPQQQVLVWGDGYYNGAIKTRKTVQPVEVSTEEAALSRSEQLRELYDSLANGNFQVTENQAQPTIRRPSVALSPEDLTESEWFYLMCVSFSFPPGVGLVGQAYGKQQQQHLWLTGANEVDCKAFTRAILAKTVVCIPLLNGVVELGTTEKVVEAVEFVQHIKLYFMVETDNPIIPPPKPALSAHSSNTTLSPHQMPTTSTKLPNDTNSMNDVDVENEEEGEDDEDEDDEEEEEENRSNFEEETGLEEVPHQHDAVVEANDQLLQSDIYEDIRFGSPNDGSSNLDGFRLLAMNQDESCRAELTQRWSDNLELPNIQLHASEAFQPDEAATEDSHYTRTVSSVLHNQLTQWSNSHSHSTPLAQYASTNSTTQSSFATWTSDHQSHHHHHLPPSTNNSQRLLKYILFTVPFLHSNNLKSSVTSRLRKTTSHDELSANHVLAERRRREKLNERFIILRSLVPLVTKMDKASILGDTIEYVKQLRKKVQDLEAARGDCHVSPEKRKMIRVGKKAAAAAVQVDVSIIESDALVELECPNREGLLVDVMKKLRELGVEVLTVQSCVDGEMVVAEIRAKVKVKVNNGKKISIMQVKKAINQIISPL